MKSLQKSHRRGILMGNVTDFNKAKLERSPHRSGMSRCMNCKHEWVAVVPSGVTSFECPQCHTNRGVYRGVPQTERPQWQCACGEWVFFVDSQGPYCCNCGRIPDLS